MWKDKVVIITGSSRGIGRNLAIELGQKGSKIILNARSKKMLEISCNDLKSRKLDVTACDGDISDYKDCVKIVDHAISKYGQVDVLINNAGICSKSNLEEIQPEVFKKIVEVNLLGSVYMTKATLPYIQKTKGSILFVGSIAGIHGIGEYSAYCSSKAALKTLVESLRIELHDSGIYIGYANVGFTENDPEKTFLDKSGIPVALPSRNEIKQEPMTKVARELMKMIERKKTISTFSFLGKLNALVNRISPIILHRFLLNLYLSNKY